MIADEVQVGAQRSARRPWIAAIVGLLLFAGVTLAWSLRPFDDYVPLVLPERNKSLVEKPDDLPVAARFECAGVFGGEDAPKPDRAAVEAMELQDLTRAPCDEIRDQHLPLVVVNVGLAVGALGALARLARRRRPPAGPATAR